MQNLPGCPSRRYENNQARFKQNDIYLTDLYSKISDVDLADIEYEISLRSTGCSSVEPRGHREDRSANTADFLR
ncbi:hypothetical protein MASR1M66_11700 [Aminivibrio sp.]